MDFRRFKLHYKRSKTNRMTKYTVWIIQAFHQRTDDGRLIDNVVLQIIADTEKEAMKKAKDYIKKPNYRLSEVIENYIK